MVIVSRHGRILQVNAQMLRLFGYTREELYGRPLEILLPERFRKIHAQHRTGYISDPHVRSMGAGLELQGRRKDGCEVPVEISLSPLETEAGVLVVAAIRDVTERKRAEAALRASEERYRSLVEQAADGIFIADPSGRYVDVNASGCRMIGYSRVEILQRSIADVVTSEEIERIVPALEAMKQGQTHLGEWQFRRKDNSTFPGEVSGIMLSDGHMLGFVRDITERQRDAIALKESEEQFRTAIDAMQEGFVMQNQAGEIVISNQSAERILGLTAEQMRGLTSLDPRWKAIHEDGSDYPAETRPIVVALRQGVAQSNVIIGVSKPSGELVWVSVNSVPLLHEGKPFAAIATFADITVRRQAEKALKESEARFRLLADSAPVMIWMTDEKGGCTYLNKLWLEFTGRTLEEGLAFGWSEDIHPDDRKTKMEEALRLFMARQPIRSEFRLRRHDGQYRYVLDNGVPVFTEDGNLLGYIGSCVDVTEQKAMQERLFESQKLESLGRLAGGVAHDFNNLLTAITGYTELAQMEVSSESEVAKFLTNVQTAAQRAAALTSQLLMYARRQMVEFAPLNLNKVILGMDPLLRRTIGEPYELVLALDERLWNVSANAAQMEQVLMNLVVNARDAMPNGGRILVETANVTLDADYAEFHPGVTPGEFAMFAVSDNGPGITKEMQARIFEPFFTTKEMGKGTGLGLATCYGIVKQSSGNIWIYSELGQGTSFKVYLPRFLATPIIEEVLAPEHLPSGTETILLVDDEPMVRDIAARVLRSQGYRVLEASNAAEALHVQDKWEGAIDLLLTDVVMPLMGGKELSQRLQQLCPGIKVLYMSGYTHNVILHQGILKPDVALITKPFTSSGLVKRVREVLNAE